MQFRSTLAAALVLVAGCSGHRPARVDAPLAAPPSGRSATAERALAHAIAWSVAGHLPADARRDCSGFIVAAWQAAGAPLKIPERYRANADGSVARMLHDWAAAEGRAFRASPAPGDLVFFRDTTGDRDGAVTHVAMVERVRDDGSVLLIHYMGGKLRQDPMDLVHPADPARNAWLRKKRHAGEPALAGELFVAYARFDGTPADAQARR